IYGDGEAMPKYITLGRIEPNARKEISITRNQGANDLQQWVPTSPQQSRQFGRFGQTPQPVPGGAIVSLKQALFHHVSQNEGLRNNTVRHLDQKWRLTKHSDEAILFARLHPQRNKDDAEKINQEPWSPTRLWLGELPDSGRPRPDLWGRLQQ